jgi:hypothetical protein
VKHTTDSTATKCKSNGKPFLLPSGPIIGIIGRVRRLRDQDYGPGCIVFEDSRVYSSGIEDFLAEFVERGCPRNMF